MTQTIKNKFLNLHLLTSYAPSCLNRDEMGMQKSATFGGVRRVRISSQCLKRSLRQSEKYAAFFGAPSTRTANRQHLLQHLQKNDRFHAFPEEILSYVIALGMKDKTVTPWILDEIEGLAQAVLSVLEKHGKTPQDLPQQASNAQGSNEDDDGEQESDKGKKKNVKVKKSVPTDFENDLKKAYTLYENDLKQAGISCLDIALSGRMCASGDLQNVEAALSVAHAISTHAMEAEIDWFTAMDDLTLENDDVGAAHLNTQEFSAAVFYLYASINLELLAHNIGGDEQAALEVASKYLELMATVSPAAKQNSFASHSLANCILALRSPLPLSLANAFEEPVRLGSKKESGYIAPSVKALTKHWENLHQKYGLDECGAFFCLDDSASDKPHSLNLCPTLAELKGWIEQCTNA